MRYVKIDGYLVKIKGDTEFFGTFREKMWLTYILPEFTKESITNLAYEIAEERNATLDETSIVIVKEANIVRFEYMTSGTFSQRYSILLTLIPLTTLTLKEKMKPSEKTSNYVCQPCGVKFLSEAQKKTSGSVSTFHTGKCGVCSKDGILVTHIRHYNYLERPKS